MERAAWKKRRIWHEEGGRKNKTLTACNRGHQKSKALQLRIIEGTGVHGSDESAGQGWPQPLLPWGCKKCHTPQIRRRGCWSFQWKRKTTHQENYFRCVHNDASHSGLKIWHLTQMWRQVHASVFKMTLNDLVHIAFSGLFVSSLGSKTTDSYEVFSPYLMWFHRDLIHLTLQNWCSTLPPHLSEIDSRVFVLFSFLFSTTSDRSNNPSGEICLIASKNPGLASSPNDVGGTWKHFFHPLENGG